MAACYGAAVENREVPWRSRPTPRDDETVRSGIERWLRSHEGEEGPVAVAPLTRPTSGLSSDTCFVEATLEPGTVRSFVVRLPPAGEGLFPAYDLEHQVGVQNALHAARIPTAPARFEPDPSWVGAPFMIMPRIPGRLMATNPSYVTSGWPASASAAEQRRVAEHFLSTLGALHALEPSAIPASHAGRDTLADEVDRWRGYLEWAAGERAAPDYLLDALAWVESTIPVSPPPSVLWGDVQFANCVFDDGGDVAALLDFELAGVGPAELDLGWFLALHEMTVATAGGVDLPGFGDRAAMLAVHDEAAGRSTTDLRWYEVFALVRSGAIMVRIARLLAARGADDSWLTRGNPTEAALTRIRSEE